jgi:hypothetical protein
MAPEPPDAVPASGAAGTKPDPAAGGEAEAEDERQAEQRFLDDLRSREEVVPEGEDLPPGATHEQVETGEGSPPAVRRRRFSAT